MIFAGLGGACLKREGLAASMLSCSLLLWNGGRPVFDVLDGWDSCSTHCLQRFITNLVPKIIKCRQGVNSNQNVAPNQIQ